MSGFKFKKVSRFSVLIGILGSLAGWTALAEPFLLAPVPAPMKQELSLGGVYTLTMIQQEPAQVVIQNPYGSVAIVESVGQVFEVEADYEGGDVVEVTVDTSAAGRIRVEAHDSRMIFAAPSGPAPAKKNRMDLFVRIPPAYLRGLSVQTDRGTIDVNGAFSELKPGRTVVLESRAGPVYLSGLNGEEIYIEAGDQILMTGLNETPFLSATSRAGDVLIREIQSGVRGQIQAPNGSIITAFDPQDACGLMLSRNIMTARPSFSH